MIHIEVVKGRARPTPVLTHDSGLQAMEPLSIIPICIQSSVQGRVQASSICALHCKQKFELLAHARSDTQATVCLLSRQPSHIGKQSV